MTHQKRMRIQWVGDIALTAQYMDPSNHRGLEENATEVARELEPADLRIANWEAPLLGVQGLNPAKRLVLHTNEETARKVLALKLNIALLANNHAFDCLESGFDKTVSFLQSSGISVLGAGTYRNQAIQPLLIDVAASPVALLAYVDETTHPQVPEKRPMCLNWLEPERVLDEVTQWAARKRTVLVHFHCGSDFVSVPSPGHRRLARRAIDSGATVVVCYHPHRIQGYERVGDGFVLYGPGNFLVGSIYPWPRFTQPTTVLTCEIEDRKVVDFRLKHFLLHRGKLTVDNKGRGVKMYQVLNSHIASPEDQYDRFWSRAAAVEHLLLRPWHFIRRHRDPLKIAAALEKRHIREAWQMLVSIVKECSGRLKG